MTKKTVIIRDCPERPVRGRRSFGHLGIHTYIPYLLVVRNVNCFFVFSAGAFVLPQEMSCVATHRMGLFDSHIRDTLPGRCEKEAPWPALQTRVGHGALCESWMKHLLCFNQTKG